MSESLWLQAKAPWFHAAPGQPPEGVDDLFELVRGGVTFRVIRGRKSTSKAAFMDEIAASLQFPLYFGENWDALDECLADMHLTPAAIVLFIAQADLVLIAEPAPELETLVQVFVSACEEYSQTVEAGRSLHIVLNGSVEGLSRWEAAGAQIAWPKTMTSRKVTSKSRSAL